MAPLSRITRPVIPALAGIAAIGCVLAVLQPAYWALGELVLLAAFTLPVPEGSAAHSDEARRDARQRRFGYWDSAPAAVTVMSVEQIANEMLTQAFRRHL